MMYQTLRCFCVLFICLVVALGAHAQSTAQPVQWFSVNAHSQPETFALKGKNIHPAAFFKQLSLYSGVEIRYEKSIIQGLDFDMQDATQAELFRYVDAQFSTLKTYTKQHDGQDVLTALTILPKGLFQSSQLVLAVEPIAEAVAHKQQQTPATAQRVYVTRLEKLELTLRNQLEHMAQQEIDAQQHKQTLRQAQQTKHQQARDNAVADLRRWQQKDPEIYQRKLAILSARYPDIEQDLKDDQ